MKKENIIWSLLAMMVLAISASLVACGSDDDDDDNGGSGVSGSMSKNVGVIDKETGMRVSTAASYYNYVYNSNGTLEYISSSYSRYEFSGNKVVYVDDDYYGDTQTAYVGYNSNGYVSTYKSNNSGEEDNGEKWSESSSASVTYDSQGHVTKIAVSFEEKEYETHGVDYEKGTITYTFTWSNNLLKKVEMMEVGEEEEGPFKYEEKMTLSYNNDANRYLQYAVFADDVFDNSFLEMVSYVGLLGKGPANLPSSLYRDYYEEYYEDGKKQTYSGTSNHNYSYGFTGVGAISYSYDNSTKYSWAYDSAKSREGNPVTKAAADDNDMPAARRHALGLTRHHRHHHVVE